MRVINELNECLNKTERRSEFYTCLYLSFHHKQKGARQKGLSGTPRKALSKCQEQSVVLMAGQENNSKPKSPKCTIVRLDPVRPVSD